MIEKPRNRHRPIVYSMVIVLLMALAFVESTTPAYAELHNGKATIPTNGATIYVPLIYHEAFGAREQTMFGVQMYGNTGANRAAFPALTESGASWVRNELPWSGVEPNNTTPDAYNWGTVSNVVGAARDGNFHILLTFNFAPEWAADNTNGPINSANIPDFVEYVGAVVERLDGDGIDDLPGRPVVNHFQFYNEPDRRPAPDMRGGWGYDPEAYAEMLKAVAPAIRAANPNAKIVFGGLAYDWFEDQGGPYVREFLDGVLAEDAGDSFDIFAFHVYPPFAPNWTTLGPGLYEKTLYIKEKLAEYGLNKPLMISEAGMHSNDDPGYPMTEEWQARYVVKLYAQSFAAGVDMMIWFSMEDPPSWYPFKNGLITDENPPVRKPAFKTYRTTVDILDGVQFDAILDTAATGAANMQAYRFRDNAAGRTVYVAWIAPVTSAEAASLSVPAGQATVTTTHGQSSTVRDAADGVTDGQVSVTVTAQPIFIEVK